MKIRLGFIILFCIFAVTLTAQTARSDSIVRVGACATPGVTWGVFVQDSFAYIADRGAFTIINISDPSAPWIVSSINDPWTGAKGVFVRDTLAYLHTSNMCTIMSVSNPSAPYRLGWCLIPYYNSSEPKGIFVKDTLAFLARSDSGFVIVNVAQTDSPTIVGKYNTPGVCVDLYVQNNLVYAADRDSLQIINVSNPTSPFRAGAVAMPVSCYDAFVIDTLAFVACLSPTGYENGTLQIVNVSDSSAPFIINNCHTAGNPCGVYVSGNYAYVASADWWYSSKKSQKKRDWIRNKDDLRADVEGGARVVKISDPSNPILAASYDTPGDSRDVFAVGDLIFIADYDSLQILQHIITGVKENERAKSSKPLKFMLFQNYPNPFGHKTIICYSCPRREKVTIKIYDSTGRLVTELLNEIESVGYHSVYWDVKNEAGKIVPSGVYIYELRSESITLRKKMVKLH